MECRAPPLFLATPGRPLVPWSSWFREFKIYAVASGWEDWSATRREALLLHCAGQEARRLYFAATAIESDTVKKEDDRVQAVSNVFLRLFPEQRPVHTERMMFRRCTQKSHQSAEVYAAELQELSSRCEFGALQDQFVCEQFIEGCSSAKLRERLCADSNLTLSKALEAARLLEGIAERQRILAAGSTPAEAPAQAESTEVEVAAVAQRTGVQRERRSGQQRSGSSTQQTQVSCWNCGGPHKARSPECPARDKRCFNCNTLGHFAKYCQRPKTRPVQTVQVLNVSSSHPDALWTEVILAGKPVRMLADTGSAVSILPYELYQRMFADVTLAGTTTRLEAYGGHRLQVRGVLQTEVSACNGRSCSASVYVVDAETPLLGRDLQLALKLSIKHGGTVCAVEQREGTLPAISGFVHRIQVKPDAIPVQQKLRPLPFALRQEVKEHLTELQEAGIIEKVDSSPWISPIVVSRKKNGKLRMCVDLRKVNEAIEVSGHPLPAMQDMLERVQGVKVFSCLDLKSAYHQLELHPESRPLTTFVCHEGLFSYRRCPYGAKSLPMAFQKVMESILKDLAGVQVYLDDVIVSGADSEEHDERLAAVLARLEQHKVTLNLDKCKMRQTSVDFLGFTVSADGVAVNSDRVKVLKEMREPKNVQELQSVLGLLGFYARFVPAYATLVEPLRQMLRKGAPPFEWTSELQVVLDEVRQRILVSPVLAMYDPSLPTRVTTDASDVGIGGVLSQLHPEGERAVCFASCSLNSAQRRYSVTEREALAAVWAVDKWRKYLWGQEFCLRVDHAALKTLLQATGVGRAGMRIARWAAKLMDYSFTVEHVKGTANPADGLSRLPAAEEDVVEDDDIVIAAVTAHPTAVSEAEFVAATRSDSVLQQLCEQVSRPWPRRARDCQSEIQPFFTCREELTVCRDMILRGERLIVPESLRSRVLELAHEGHQGIVRCKQRLRQLYWWPGMDHDAEAAVKMCSICASVDKTALPRQTPLHPVPLPAAPWDKVGLDFIGPMEAPRGQRYALVLVDYFSKWLEVGFCSEPSTVAAIEFLEAVASREGYPREVVSDNGTHFTSSHFRNYLREVGVQHVRVTPYHPAGSGAVERCNRTVKSALQAADLQGTDRRVYMQRFLQQYRSTPHGTTGVSPAELLHGRRLRTGLHAVNIEVTQELTSGSGDLRQRVAERQRRQKAYADRTRHAKTPDFRIGEWVRYQIRPRPRKGRLRYSEPVQIVGRRGPNSFLLTGGALVHAERLTRWTALPPSTDSPSETWSSGPTELPMDRRTTESEEPQVEPNAPESTELPEREQPEPRAEQFVDPEMSSGDDNQIRRSVSPRGSVTPPDRGVYMSEDLRCTRSGRIIRKPKRYGE